MTRAPRLLVVDPSIVWPEHEGVAEIVGDWPGSWRVVRPALEPGSGLGPAEGYEADAIVVMGSRASVNDDLPWLRRLGAWLDPVLAGAPRIPLLGICFGHQLIAHRAGATVAKLRADGSEEKGIQTTRFAGSRLAPDGPMRVVASHGEAVLEAPAGYRITACRDRVRIDALEHETLPVYSVQFHPEARGDFLSRRGVAAGPEDATAFEEQARYLAAFRRAARSDGG